MFKLGLTGSIGMGKSTTAQIFADEGCAVWDADAAVHRLYSRGGNAVPDFQTHFPQAVIDGAVSRDILKSLIGQDPNVLKKIEQIVHPLVHQDRTAFIAKSDADVMVFDIPLLFEKNSQSQFDAVACVYVEPEEQQARVLARGTMTEDQFKMILSKQMPIGEKRALADYEIHTDTLKNARQQVKNILAKIKGNQPHA